MIQAAAATDAAQSAGNGGEGGLFAPPTHDGHRTHLRSLEEYRRLHAESVAQPGAFFGRLGRELLAWETPFEGDACDSGAGVGDGGAWFAGGRINVSRNCVDRHAAAAPDSVAILWEGDDLEEDPKISDDPNSRNDPNGKNDPAITPITKLNNGIRTRWTYRELLAEVCRFAHVLRRLGVSRGDAVAIYMPMVPHAAIAMLACARIGAVHSVVFAGFSADALRDRINDAACAVLVTADQGRRGGKPVHLKRIADEAVAGCPSITSVVVFQRTGDPDVPFCPPRDVWWHDAIEAMPDTFPPEPMDAEDPLFMLYTSGSTGKPKGIVHSQAGYLLGVAASAKYVFDIHPGDVFGCMADVGWITGHSYIVYGPLCLGATTVMFESVPTYPNPGRYWDLVDRLRITQFYTAPTAIRALRRLGDDHVRPYRLDSLRVLGSVGEPINPEAWLWYHNIVGRGRCMVVDTYWQTETGSHVITPIPGVTPTKPGSATLPFFGIDVAILDPETGRELIGNNVSGVLAIRKPFPSIARTIYKDHDRFLKTYMQPYPGFYFTGDGATRDQDGYIWIKGRLDDVINVAGHRLSTAEIEAALILHPSCAEAAVVGVPHEVTGQAIVCFCCFKIQSDPAALEIALKNQVRAHIGPFATPQRIVIVQDLPKTRSGKIMRRILRKIASHEVTKADLVDEHALHDRLGDLSTLADPSVVRLLIENY